MGTRLAVIALLCALGLSACGGDDAGEQRQGDAESTVRSYLAALVAKDGRAACSKFTPEYQRSVVSQNADFARERNIRECAPLIDAVTETTPSITFERKPLTRDNGDEIKFKTTVRKSGEEHNATVTGQAGTQRYELETRDGRWLISGIERVG